MAAAATDAPDDMLTDVPAEPLISEADMDVEKELEPIDAKTGDDAGEQLVCNEQGNCCTSAEVHTCYTINLWAPDMTFYMSSSQEVSGWRGMMECAKVRLGHSN